MEGITDYSYSLFLISKNAETWIVSAFYVYALLCTLFILSMSEVYSFC